MGHQRVREPGLSLWAPTMISRSALSIERTAKAEQSSSGAKQTAMAAPEATDEVGNVGRARQGPAREHQRAPESTREHQRAPESTREHQRARNRYVRVALTHPYRVGLLTKTASSATVPVRPSPYSGFRWAPGELRVLRCRIKRLPRWSRPSRWWKLEWSLRWPLIRPHEVEVLPDRRQPGR